MNTIDIRDMFRVKNTDVDMLVSTYGDEMEVLFQEDQYSMVKMTYEQYKDLIANEIFVVRC